jgi:hypothetical protein
MCGENSMYAVESKTSVGAVASKDGVKILWVAERFSGLGEIKIGESHKAIKSTHKLPATRRFVNINIRDGRMVYEKGIPSWFNAKLQKSAELQAKAIVKAVAAYNKALATAEVTRDNAIELATMRANKALVARKNTEYAKLVKLGAK